MATKFDKSELEFKGIYQDAGLYFGSPFPEAPIFDTPITPKENLTRFLEHKDYEWVPNALLDVNWICPDEVPDVLAIGLEGGVDSFGVQWVPTRPDLGLPAMVKPGDPTLEEIADWTDLEWPDVDSWDWEHVGQQYASSPKERMNLGVVNTGYFERLIALLDFEGAAIALLDDPESVCEFFDKLTDFNIDVARHYKKYCNTDMIVIFDDWGSQKSTFFSHDTLRETIFPFYKRMATAIHDMDMYVYTHCDGHVAGFVPDMIEQGTDLWMVQVSANPEIEKTIEKYGDKILFDLNITVEEQPSISDYEKVARGIYTNGNSRALNIMDDMGGASIERAKINYEMSRRWACGDLVEVPVA